MGLKFAIMQMDLKVLKMLHHKNGSFVISRVSSNHGQIEVPPPPNSSRPILHTVFRNDWGSFQHLFVGFFICIYSNQRLGTNFDKFGKLGNKFLTLS